MATTTPTKRTVVVITYEDGTSDRFRIKLSHLYDAGNFDPRPVDDQQRSLVAAYIAAGSPGDFREWLDRVESAREEAEEIPPTNGNRQRPR